MARGEFHSHHRIRALRNTARRLRKAPTHSEKILWQALRNRRLQGLKFLRQHPIGPSIVDFYCHEKRLAVEIDGPIHNEPDVVERDRAREESVAVNDIQFLRCKSEEVERDLAGVLLRIREAAEE